MKPAITYDEERDELYDSRLKEAWEVREAKAQKLMADSDWIQDTMIRFQLFDDISAACRGDADQLYKAIRQIQDYARRRTEEI